MRAGSQDAGDHGGPVRDPCHGRRSRRQRTPWRGSSTRLLGAFGRNADSKEERDRRARRRLGRANRGLRPLCEGRSGSGGERRSGSKSKRADDRDCVAPQFHRGRWGPSEAADLSSVRGRPEDLPAHEGPPGRRSQRNSWRRSGSAPAAGIGSTQPGRGPGRPPLGVFSNAFRARAALLRDGEGLPKSVDRRSRRHGCGGTGSAISRQS